jgi:predicted RNA binding protein YcfA (HicA-like mRNA interferase family)
MPVTVQEAVRIVEADGWVMVKRTGTGHRQFRHPVKAGIK